MSGNGPVDNQNEQNWVNFVCIRVKLDKQKKILTTEFTLRSVIYRLLFEHERIFFQWNFLQNASYENSWLENF